MKETVHIDGKFLWRWGRSKNGVYVAICDAIQQTVQADRFEELIEIMNEALDSTFRDLFKSGDLDKFLRSNGWTKQETSERRKGANVRFDVPFEVKGMGQRDLEAALC